MSNSLDSDQNRWSVSPDLGPNCLQRFCCRLLTFFKINFFKRFFQEHYQNVNSLDSDQDKWSVGLSVLIWVQTVFKGYQQTTKVGISKERVKIILKLFIELHRSR